MQIFNFDSCFVGLRSCIPTACFAHTKLNTNQPASERTKNRCLRVFVISISFDGVIDVFQITCQQIYTFLGFLAMSSLNEYNLIIIFEVCIKWLWNDFQPKIHLKSPVKPLFLNLSLRSHIILDLRVSNEFPLVCTCTHSHTHAHASYAWNWSQLLHTVHPLIGEQRTAIIFLFSFFFPFNFILIQTLPARRTWLLWKYNLVNNENVHFHLGPRRFLCAVHHFYLV